VGTVRYVVEDINGFEMLRHRTLRLGERGLEVRGRQVGPCGWGGGGAPSSCFSVSVSMYFSLGLWVHIVQRRLCAYTVCLFTPFCLRAFVPVCHCLIVSQSVCRCPFVSFSGCVRFVRMSTSLGVCASLPVCLGACVPGCPCFWVRGYLVVRVPMFLGACAQCT
jgi:hypothetical protein